MTTRLDDYLSARFQACCLNYNHYIKKLFGDEYGIDKHLSFSLQFSSITDDQVKQLKEFSELPENIAAYINAFDNTLSDEEFNNPQYSYRVLYVPKTVNNRGTADKVIEFVKADSPEAASLNKEYHIIKEKERPKFLPKAIIKMMNDKGFKRLNMHHHTQLWKKLNARDETKGFGVSVSGFWYWYENWIKEVDKYCEENKGELI